MKTAYVWVAMLDAALDLLESGIGDPEDVKTAKIIVGTCINDLGIWEAVGVERRAERIERAARLGFTNIIVDGEWEVCDGGES